MTGFTLDVSDVSCVEVNGRCVTGNDAAPIDVQERQSLKSYVGFCVDDVGVHYRILLTCTLVHRRVKCTEQMNRRCTALIFPAFHVNLPRFASCVPQTPDSLLMPGSLYLPGCSSERRS